MNFRDRRKRQQWFARFKAGLEVLDAVVDILDGVDATDRYGRTFNPAIHRVNRRGEPRIGRTGKLMIKPKGER